MRAKRRFPALLVSAIGLAFLAFPADPAAGQLDLGSAEFVLSSGLPIQVPGYSVPSYAHWDDDGLPDLIVGEGSGIYTPKVRVYLNAGSAQSPVFSGWSYAQAAGGDLTTPGSGCLGLFPRTVYWDGDGLKDLIVGQADGKIRLFTNVGSEASPTFDAGVFLQAGPAGAKQDISVGYRATPMVVDWDSDGAKDLVVGALDGKIHIFVNEGTDAAPDFQTKIMAQDGGADLAVLSSRSSPHVRDVNGDGRKDLIAGNTNGQLVEYLNVGTDAAPSFDGYTFVESNGADIDLPGVPRSRPFVFKWPGDGLLDALIGYESGIVLLYQGVPKPGDANKDGCVDGLDYIVWSNNYRTGTTWEEGDFTGDTIVDGLDYVVWSNNYDPGCIPPGVVPEPAAVSLLAIGTLALLKRRSSR